MPATDTKAKPATRRPLTPAIRKRAILGEIATVLMNSERHRTLPIAMLSAVIAPAITTQQYSIAERKVDDAGNTLPVAFVIWASVSDAVDNRLVLGTDRPMQLDKQEWKSGPNIWLIEAAGDARAVTALMNQLQNTIWAGKQVKMRAKKKDGKTGIRILNTKPAKDPARKANGKTTDQA
jgi:hemolysin-activating ACP:hemolysin acyltransferase